MRQYIAIIHKETDSDFGVSFPDFPGCVSAGADLDDAHRMGAEALQLHVEGMMEDGLPIPEPSSLEAVMQDRNARNGVAILIPLANPQPKVVRVNITMPDDVLWAIDRFAEAHGLTRSGFLASAAKKAMEDA